MNNSSAEACNECPYSWMTEALFLDKAPCPPVWNKGLLWDAVLNCSLSVKETEIIAERCNVPLRHTTQTYSSTGVGSNGATGVGSSGSTNLGSSGAINVGSSGATKNTGAPGTDPVTKSAAMLENTYSGGCNIACIFAIIGGVILLVIVVVVIYIWIQRRKEIARRGIAGKTARKPSSSYRDSMLSTNSTQGLYPNTRNGSASYQHRWDETYQAPPVILNNPVFNDSPPFTRRRSRDEQKSFQKSDDSNGTTVLGLSVIQPGYVYVNPSLRDIEMEEPRTDYDIPYMDEDKGHTYHSLEPDYTNSNSFVSERL